MIYLRKTVILFDLIIRLWNKYTEVRQEAVQQALAAMQGRPKPSLPMPSKRTSVMARSPDRERRDSGESSSDEDSVVTEESPGAGGPTGICPSISLSLLVSFFSITSRLYIFVRLASSFIYLHSANDGTGYATFPLNGEAVWIRVLNANPLSRYSRMLGNCKKLENETLQLSNKDFILFSKMPRSKEQLKRWKEHRWNGADTVTNIYNAIVYINFNEIYYQHWIHLYTI